MDTLHQVWRGFGLCWSAAQMHGWLMRDRGDRRYWHSRNTGRVIPLINLQHDVFFAWLSQP